MSWLCGLRTFNRVDSAEDGGYTPLYWAAHRGHANIVSLLIRNGANPKVIRWHSHFSTGLVAADVLR